MASIEKLQKLYHIQSLCQSEQSLESAVAEERVTQAIQRTEQLIRQRAFLREERRHLRIYSEKAEQRSTALKIMRRPDWVPQSIQAMVLPIPSKAPAAPSSSASTTANITQLLVAETPSSSSSSAVPSSSSKPPTNSTKTEGPEETVCINIGGLMFETSISILKRDPGSLLAQLVPTGVGAGATSPIAPVILPDPEGFYYFDRDWWLFRHVLQFLRDGSLPDDRPLLAQLYREAAFFHLHEMQKAIEEEKLHLRTPSAVKNKEADKKWWRTLPNWTQALVEAKKVEDSKKKKEDWWLDSNYKGRTYLPLSSAPEKVVTSRGERDEQKIPQGTWAATPSSSSYEDSAYRGSGQGSGGGYRGYQQESDSDYRGTQRASPLPQSYPYPYPFRDSDGGGNGSYRDAAPHMPPFQQRYGPTDMAGGGPGYK